MYMRIDRNSPLPLYHQLKEIIKEQIRAGRLLPGQTIPSEIELTRTYKLSRYTVRQAISDLVAEGILRRVHGTGTFVSDSRKPAGIRAAKGRGSIGVIVPYLGDFFISEILAGIEQITDGSNYNLIFCNSDNDMAEQARHINTLSREGVEGLIVFPVENAPYDETIARLAGEGFPLMLVDRYYDNIGGYDFVGCDNRKGVYQAIDHLFELGHQHIGFITHPFLSTTSVRERLEGYKEAIERHNLHFDESLVVTYPSRLVEENTMASELDDDLRYEPILRLLDRRDRPSAVFALNDFVAIDVIKVCKRHGIRIPEDLSLVGFDDIEMARYLEVPLTTVAQPKREIGVAAARILLERIEAGHMPGKQWEEKRILLPTTLVVRDSTAANWRCPARQCAAGNCQ